MDNTSSGYPYRYALPIRYTNGNVVWKAPISVDTETTGLEVDHEIISIAAVPLEGPPIELYMMPEHIETAQPRALEINGYNKLSWQDIISQQEQKTRIECFTKLQSVWTGNVVIGSNPAFDIRFITRALHELADAPTFHYKPVCVDTLMLGAGGDALASLSWLDKKYGDGNGADHTALGDAQTAMTIYKKWWDMTFANNLPHGW